MHLDNFIFSAVLLLTVTSLAVALFRHLGLGSILGLLVAGVVVGPHSPGPYITTHVEDVRHFAELGVVMLLFLIGLEMKPDRLWAMRRQVFGFGSAQILLAGAGITLYAALVGETWRTALLTGLTLALSSTAFVMQLLQERGEFASRHGRGAFAVLLMQDLAVVPLLALVPLLSTKAAISSGIPLWEQLLIMVGMIGALAVFGRWVVPFALDRLARHQNREAFLLVVLLAVFFAAWAMHLAGVSMAMGAFLMGMMLSTSRYNLQVHASIEPYKGMLMSLFFVAVGMSIDLGALAERPLLFVQHAAAVVGIKLAVLFPLAIAFGFSRRDSVRLTFLLAQAGEFGFVLFGSALVLEVIDEAAFILAVGVISLSMLLTPLLVRLGDALAERMERGGEEEGEVSVEISGEEGERRVVIAGYGRMGHTIAALLHSSGIPFIAFDTNPERVAAGQANGHRVHYGDLSDPDLLAAAHVGRAALVVLTIDRAEVALRAASMLHTHCPHVPVIARARDLESCSRLLQAGVTQAYPEAVEASLRLGAEAMQMVGSPSDSVNQLLNGVRGQGYELVREDRSE